MSEESAIGARMGDYEILAVLGAGGMGKVYKVRNVLSDRVEAMKVLLPNLAGQKELAGRFLQEIKVLAALHHPNIAELRTALTIDNQLVMIMEYVPGTTLAALIERGAIPCGEALGYIDRVLDALSYAHQRQVIHRDIKPSNMMLTEDGVIKLMDFGIARVGPDMGLTMTGTTLGSLPYMSPEQVKCGTIDARSDLYSVGVSLYEMVTGKRPFQADSDFLIMQAHLQEPPKPPIQVQPGLPVAVNQIILMAMEKDPARRFQSADAFRNALKAAAADGGAARPAVSNAPSAQPQPSAEGRGAAPISLNRTPSPSPAFAPAIPSTQMPAGSQSHVPPPNTGGHRGLYITLGALIVVAILVAASFLVPRWRNARAGATSSPANTMAPNAANPAAATAPPATVPPAPVQPGLTAQPAAAPAAENSVTPSSAPRGNIAARNQKEPSPSSDRAQPAQPAPPEQALPPQPDPAQLAELDHEVDQLTSREAAVNASLENLQRQQSAQGVGLRGDMVAAQQRMQINAAKAQAALQAQDIPSTRKYLDLAEADAEKLEKFLGR